MSIFSGWLSRTKHKGARRDGVRRISRRLALGLIVAVSLTSGFAAKTKAADSELQGVLAPSGKLKAGLYTGTPTSYLPSQSGEPKGVGVFVEYLDGRKVFMGGSAPGADGNPTPKKEQ